MAQKVGRGKIYPPVPPPPSARQNLLCFIHSYKGVFSVQRLPASDIYIVNFHNIISCRQINMFFLFIVFFFFCQATIYRKEAFVLPFLVLKKIVSSLSSLSVCLHPLLKCIIIYMKKLLDSDWLRAVQFKCNTSAKSVIPVQKV